MTKRIQKISLLERNKTIFFEIYKLKKTAEDAIKQARYFQRKLNREIDQIHDNIAGTDLIGDISLTLPNYGSEVLEDDPIVPQSNGNHNHNNRNHNHNHNKSKRPKSAENRGVNSLEDNFYANPLFKFPKYDQYFYSEGTNTR